MPTTVFISSDGTIVEKSVGAIDANFLARASRELLAAEAATGGGTRELRPKLAGLPHLILELFADERVRRRAFDVHGEAVKFVSDRLVADLLK